MKLASFEIIINALNGAGVRYLVAGGVAVNAHGFLRATKDVDIVIQLTATNIEAALRALESIDYRPAQRETWRREKQMLVLKMWSDSHRETPIDIFVYEPFDFDLEYERALSELDEGDIPARFVSIPALVGMKREAGRAQDLIDIEKLSEILRLESDAN